MCNPLPTYRLRTMEVSIQNASTGIFYLSQDNSLEAAKRIVYIEALSVSDTSVGPSLGLALQADNVFNAAFLTLVTKDGNQERVSKIPLRSLNRKSNNGVLQPFKLPVLNMTACYINVPNNSGVTVDPLKIFMLQWHYMLEGDDK